MISLLLALLIASSNVSKNWLPIFAWIDVLAYAFVDWNIAVKNIKHIKNIFFIIIPPRFN